MQYSTTIDVASEYGITAARNAYNASLQTTVKQEIPEETVDGVTVPAHNIDVPNPELILSDTAYLDMVLQRAVQSWCTQYAPVVTPPVPTTTVNGVPQAITKRQGRAQLKIEGLLTAIEGFITSLPSDNNTRMAYEDSSEWIRTNPDLISMMTMLTKTDAEADAFFVAAAKL